MQVYCSKNHANQPGNRFCTQCGEPLPLSTGVMIGDRYRIMKQLGQGGFGRTYLAEDTQQSQKTCVLKEFAPLVEDTQNLDKAKELFEREANVLKKLQHSQIPRFHSSLQVKLGNKDFFFLVQDYIEGDNFLDLLEKRRFTEEEVIKLLQQILPVLSYLHSRDVIHRDISPDNLIWRKSDDLPVLIDFGAVKQLPASKGFWFTQLAGNRTLLGKKGYAPEEQLRQGKAFPSSDLYALAVTALVLITGKEPPKLYDSYNGNWSWGKEIQVSPKLETVLKKMLSYKPSDRYQTAQEVFKQIQYLAPSIKAVNTAVVTAQPIVTPAVKTLNPLITKIKTMVVAPGKKPPAVISKFQHQTQAAVQSLPVPIWMRPFAYSLIGTSVAILTFAGSWALVSAVIRGVSSISLPSISLPKDESPKKSTNQQKPGKLTQAINRRQELAIPEGFFNLTVNRIFHAENPQLNGRALTSGAEDAALREEWANVANKFLDKITEAKLSQSTREKLGSYGGKDYAAWRTKAQNGELGNYTLEKLNSETNRKFDKLFPGIRQDNEKLDPQTYSQIWYAIAAEQISKIGTEN
ncbi:serine/threonine-protein kinase [Calothrix sp. 336/3]|uniref:serine/threonine-protein kinase n=1 Tax=Calothrix sp. 336/3 TaxID=1337936 RepID=UPI0004E3BCAE|nr:serine/threonine-protein kinase [Calothrix sp. 336/3]AKG20556.1 serine/threonine protein kinase [Calothrix sp. 336/3]